MRNTADTLDIYNIARMCGVAKEGLRDFERGFETVATGNMNVVREIDDFVACAAVSLLSVSAGPNGIHSPETRLGAMVAAYQARKAELL